MFKSHAAHHQFESRMTTTIKNEIVEAVQFYLRGGGKSPKRVFIPADRVWEFALLDYMQLGPLYEQIVDLGPVEALQSCESLFGLKPIIEGVGAKFRVEGDKKDKREEPKKSDDSPEKN